MAGNEFLKNVEDKIKDAAKAVEELADEIAAPEAPLVILPDDDATTSKPVADGGSDGKVK